MSLLEKLDILNRPKEKPRYKKKSFTSISPMIYSSFYLKSHLPVLGWFQACYICSMPTTKVFNLKKTEKNIYICVNCIKKNHKFINPISNIYIFPSDLKLKHGMDIPATCGVKGSCSLY